MTRAVFSMVSEIVRMPAIVRPTASSPVRASSEARLLMRSASSAILATSLTAAAISETVWAVFWAAWLSDSALWATDAMKVVSSSTVADVSGRRARGGRGLAHPSPRPPGQPPVPAGAADPHRLGGAALAPRAPPPHHGARGPHPLPRRVPPEKRARCERGGGDEEGAKED